jgi:hypothetical protein
MAAGNTAERYLQEGPIQLSLWQWQSAWLTEINSYIDFLSSKKRKRNHMVGDSEYGGCSKTVTYSFATPLGQAQSCAGAFSCSNSHFFML